MAITRKPQPPLDSPHEFRQMLRPFTEDESGIQVLKGCIDGENKINREGMYLLNILNNLIQSENGKEKVFQRIPSEVFGGLSEGGRRNVQASLIARAVRGADEKEQGRVLASGYTAIQEVIGRWAERDGSWSDTPEGDLIDRGFTHSPENDGSEARIFHNKNTDDLVYKTVDFSHYSHFELMMDRIAIHNAIFPEMAIKVEGFGMRDDTTDDPERFHEGFVVTISQKKAIGHIPTQKEIEKGLTARGFDRTDNGFFWLNIMDNVVIADIHDLNCVVSPEGNLLVFDCEAFLKTFPVDAEKPEVILIKDALPSKDGKLDEKTWRAILGSEYDNATLADKTALLKELRQRGKISGLIDGKVITLDNNVPKFRQDLDGRTVQYYDGNILVGRPRAFEKEHLWNVPPIQSDATRVNLIRDTLHHLVPQTVDLNDFFNDPGWSGAIAMRGNAAERNECIRTLKKNGIHEGLINGHWVVQMDPSDSNKVLVSEPSRLAFMLWTNSSALDDYPELGKLSSEQKEYLSAGYAIDVNGSRFVFDLDKGRIDKKAILQRRLSKKIDQANNKPIDQKKKPSRKNGMRL